MDKIKYILLIIFLSSCYSSSDRYYEDSVDSLIRAVERYERESETTIRLLKQHAKLMHRAGYMQGYARGLQEDQSTEFVPASLEEFQKQYSLDSIVAFKYNKVLR